MYNTIYTHTIKTAISDKHLAISHDTCGTIRAAERGRNCCILPWANSSSTKLYSNKTVSLLRNCTMIGAITLTFNLILKLCVEDSP